MWSNSLINDYDKTKSKVSTMTLSHTRVRHRHSDQTVTLSKIKSKKEWCKDKTLLDYYPPWAVDGRCTRRHRRRGRLICPRPLSDEPWPDFHSVYLSVWNVVWSFSSLELLTWWCRVSFTPKQNLLCFISLCSCADSGRVATTPLAHTLTHTPVYLTETKNGSYSVFLLFFFSIAI